MDADPFAPRPILLDPVRDRQLGAAPPPASLTSFVGREREVEAVSTLLRDDGVRLLTLTGPGGVGKTRLALRVAREVGAAFPDGVVFGPLAGITTADHVAAAIAQALGIRETADQALGERLIAAIRERRLLLVLDNFEHVLAAAPLVSSLMAACPSLAVLVTSRAALRLAGEHVVAVAPLPLPDLGWGDGSAGARTAPVALTDNAAVRLLIERAGAADADFAASAADIPVIAAICHRLDGLPLAIELAAARIPVLPPAALLARLERRLPLLTHGTRDLPDRQRTLRDAIAWSHELLTPAEQALFRRLAVFVGGATLDAIEWVMGDGSWVMGDGTDVSSSPSPITHHPSPGVFDALAALVEQSLVRRAIGPDGEPRFAMLETIREFASERLAATGEAAAIRERHAGFFLDLAERLEFASVMPDREQLLARLEVDHANLLGALAWLNEVGDGERELRLAGALRGFWLGRSHYREGQRWLEQALSRGHAAPALVRAKALTGLALILTNRGDDDRAEPLFVEGVALLRREDDALRTAIALIGYGWLASHSGRYEEAAALLAEARALAQRIDEPTLAASVSGLAHTNLGVAAHGQGELALAVTHLEAALDHYRGIGYARGEIQALLVLGDVARDRGDHHRAWTHYRECLTLVDEGGDKRVIIDALEGLASVAAWAATVPAARLLGAAEALREAIGTTLLLPAERAAHERAVTAARTALGEPAFGDARAAGRAVPVADAILEAIALEPPSGGPRVSLTPREAEIVPLLAAGRTNPQIADALFLSTRTVENHVARLFAKLGVRTRAAAVDAARATSLLP